MFALKKDVSIRDACIRKIFVLERDICIRERYSGCQKYESSLIFVKKLEIRLHLEF